MAWTTPRAWVTGETVSAASMNTHVRDNMLEAAPAKAQTAGDVFYATAANALTALPISGQAGKSLAANTGETAIEYVEPLQSLTAAQGDVIYGAAANTPARLPKGSARQGLSMNSGATTPEWTDSLQSLMTARGDIVQASAANAPARLPLGAAGQKLIVNSGATALEYGDGVVAITVTEFLSGRTNDTLGWAGRGNWRYKSLTSTREIGFVWAAPDNLASITSMEIVILPDAAETIQADLHFSIAAPGERYDNDTEDQDNQTLAVSQYVITEWNVGAVFSGLGDIVAGDYVALDFQSDTSNIYVLGLKIVWVTT